MKKFLEVPVEKLKWTCDPRLFKFKSTEEIKVLEGMIGQERAISALEFGLDMESKGFNIYVAGPVGTGKNSTVNVLARKFAEKKAIPNDWCYVHNFKNPDEPIAISLKAGTGKAFVKNMNELIEEVKIAIPKVFESAEYEKHKNEIINKFQAIREKYLSEAQARARNEGFVLQQTPAGIVTFPHKNGKPISPEEYDKLTDKEKKEIQKKEEKVREMVNEMLVLIRKKEKEAREEVKKIDREAALYAVGHIINDFKERYKKHPKIIEYLEEVKEDIISNIEDFKSPRKEAPVSDNLQGMSPFEKYKVNLLVDNTNLKGAPVVVENNPTYYNLFGRIEYEPRAGAMVTSFNLIKPGAFHRANGGYLILQARDVLLNYFSWDALKRAIRNREIKIENMGEQFRTIPAVTLKPECIPADVKVILVGNRWLYYLLYEFDEDFRKLFKVKADFNVDMKRTSENIQKYCSFIALKCRQDNLIPFDSTGIARVIEYGVYLTGDQQRLSTKFIEIADIISEASYLAEKEKSKFVTKAHVEKAIKAKEYRSNMIEERIQELIEDGTIMIDVKGEKIGQVNGLSVYQLGDYSFGKPSRITARTYIGKAGVINIERETEMSGKIHSKGVMILTGYLGEKYAHNKPLSLSASLCFEQLYEEVEGDSASSTELYAILSSLSGLPIKQSIAVTGSLNQKGEIQPIGGVNEKIEGFYTVCKAKGLTGTQGVIIPYQNIKNLMLKEEVITAVKEGKFHIYPVKTVDEGIEILTGVPAGKRINGSYKKNTVNYLVDKRLEEMAKEIKEFEKEE